MIITATSLQIKYLTWRHAKQEHLTSPDQAQDGWSKEHDLIIRMAGDDQHPLGPLQLLHTLVGLDPREDEVEEKAGNEYGKEQDS